MGLGLLGMDRLDHDVADYPNLNKRLYKNSGKPWELVDISSVSCPDAGKNS